MSSPSSSTNWKAQLIKMLPMPNLNICFTISWILSRTFFKSKPICNYPTGCPYWFLLRSIFRFCCWFFAYLVLINNFNTENKSLPTVFLCDFLLSLSPALPGFKLLAKRLLSELLDLSSVRQFVLFGLIFTQQFFKFLFSHGARLIYGFYKDLRWCVQNMRSSITACHCWPSNTPYCHCLEIFNCVRGLHYTLLKLMPY